ncbi:serine/threonine-protein kinase B-raf-like isoform X2 [Styela clava]|uniref:serine/threonine-protein kinase B-raf-like n=1 Tax=Styela clava TaxID=7725 RepID=UPI001939A816|nr:serine/threonine-protein kinase B-raf-like [Styela clava]
MVGSSKRMSTMTQPLFSSEGRRSSDIRKIQEDLQNLNEVIRLTKDSIIRLNDKFGGNTNPPPIYLEEYRELTDKLGDLQTRHHNLTDVLEQQLLQGSQTNSFSQEPSGVQTLPGNRIFFPPGPQYVGTEPAYDTSDGSHHNGTNNQLGKTVGVIRIFLPNGKTTVGAVIGKSLKSQVLQKTARLKDLRDKADQCSVFKFGTNQPVDWEVDSGRLAGMELELRTDNKSFKEKTRILQAEHNFTRKTFLTLTYCDHCQRILFHGMYCKMCSLKLHQRCIHLAQEFCITKDQIIKISEKIRAPTPSPDSPKTPTDTSGTVPIPIPMDDRITFTRSRSSSQPSLIIYKTATGQDYNESHLSGRPGYSVTPPTSSIQSAAATIGSLPAVGYRNKTHHGSGTMRRDSNDDWEVPEEEIEWGDKIGSGSYGTVFRCRWHGVVAVKKLNVTSPTPSQLQAFRNEVAVLKKTRHVNILLFMGYTIKKQLCIVTQWCEGSSLYRHLHVIETKFDMVQLVDIARQIAQGMDYLHAKNIIHRDMKSNNIFLLEDFTVKVGDFGLATVKSRWSGSEQLMQPTGSILWMAPEIIRMQGGNPYSFKSDVYAFGIVLYELSSGKLPYQHIGSRDLILFQVGRGILSPNLSYLRNDTPKAFKRLILDCSKKGKEERPLFPQIVASLENLYRALPKICRSQSEPSLNRSGFSGDDFFTLASPKTPISHAPYTFVSP